MKTCNRAHEREVAAIAARLLGPSVSIEPIPTFPDSIVYRLQGDQGSLIFKGHDSDGRDSDSVTAEAWALEAAAQRGVPAPAVVALDTSTSAFPSSYLVMTAATGVPMDSLTPREVADVAPALGRVLRRLHDGEVRGFGRLAATAGLPEGAHNSWADYVLSGLPDALRYLEAFAREEVDAGRLRAGVERASAEVTEPPIAALLHGDLGENHVFVEPDTGEIEMVIDFGEAGAGDFVWDLIELHRPLVATVLDGYGVTPEDRAQIEHQVVIYALLKAVPWAAKWHARGETQVLEWLQLTLVMAEDSTAPVA